MDNRNARFLLGFLIMLVFFAVRERVNASDFYVANLSEFQSAVSSVQPGDTITMASAEWSNVQLYFQTDGTETDSIRLRAEEPGRVILNGNSSLKIAGDYLVVDGLQFKGGYTTSGSVIEFRNGSNWSTHSRLTNTAIINYNPAGVGTDYKWVSLYGFHNRVDHCYFRGKNHSGTTLVVWLAIQPNYHLIDHNYFAYRPELGFNGGETIRVGTSDYSMYDSYTIVENNYFEHCNGESEIISNKSCENIYRYNTFYECEGALTLRHGNRCTVEGNFFLGNKKSQTGGVRIIGEDHKVFNNYFQDLYGGGYRCALGIMNGIPGSPLNGYFQVKNAQVMFNTFVNCAKSMIVGLGKDSEKTLPPENCLIANNIVTALQPLVQFEDQPVNLSWAGNIMFGPQLGIPLPPAGITLVDPQMVWSADSLWRPDASSPVLNAAAGNYPDVVDDMDGQPRSGAKDVGSDEFSADPVIRRPLTADDTGPAWFPLPPEPPTIIQVAAGTDSLKNALLLAEDRNIIELTTDGGVYGNSSNLAVIQKVTIRAADGLSQRPVVRQTNASTSTRILFEIKDGGSLSLKGIELDGMAGSATPAKYLIRTDDDPMTASYNLKVEDCYLHDVVIGPDGNFFRAYAGSFADTIIFRNSLFKTAGKEGIRLKDEASGSGLFNVDYFELENCTFWDVKKEAVSIYAGDDVPFTPGPKVIINHCTFDSCGYDGAHVIFPNEVDGTVIKNSIFSNSTNSGFSLQLYGYGSTITHCDTFEVGPVVVNRGATIGAGMLGADPLYLDRTAGDFTLAQNSPLWWKADDGKALGDLRWAGNPPNALPGGDETLVTQGFTLEQNYPNPFNPSTKIRFTLGKSAVLSLQVFDVRGRLVTTLLQGSRPAGEYSVEWRPGNEASGIYVCRLLANGQAQIRKLMFIK